MGAQVAKGESVTSETKQTRKVPPKLCQLMLVQSNCPRLRVLRVFSPFAGLVHYPRDFPGKLRTSDADCGSAARRGPTRCKSF